MAPPPPPPSSPASVIASSTMVGTIAGADWVGTDLGSCPGPIVLDPLAESGVRCTYNGPEKFIACEQGSLQKHTNNTYACPREHTLMGLTQQEGGVPPGQVRVGGNVVM